MTTATNLDRIEKAVDRTSTDLNEAAHAERVTTLGYLAAGLSHELAQPLLAAHNFSTLAVSLCEKLTAKDNALVEAVIDVNSQIDRAIQIVKRIQSFISRSRPVAASFDINAAVNEVVSLLSHESLERSIRLKLHLQFALPQVYADNVLIQQVIVNLLRNAMDAVAGLKMDERQIELETAPEHPDQVRLTVADRGPGVEPQNLELIFTPCYSTKPTGWGMGLWLSRTIIEANGGRLWAEKRPSGGAIFCFTLPVSDGAT